MKCQHRGIITATYNIFIVQPASYELIHKLAAEVDLFEKIDFRCVFLGAVDGEGKLAGVAGFRIDYKNPRFEHIIVDEKHRGSRLALTLMLSTERFLRDKGYKQYVALIDNDNKFMRDYATKFGFTEYAKKEKRAWFYKNL